MIKSDYVNWFNKNKALIETNQWDKFAEETCKIFNLFDQIEIANILKEAGVKIGFDTLYNKLNNLSEDTVFYLRAIINVELRGNIHSLYKDNSEWKFFNERDKVTCNIKFLINCILIIIDGDIVVTADKLSELIEKLEDLKLFNIDWNKYGV